MKKNGFCGEGLKGALQFAFILLTILFAIFAYYGDADASEQVYALPLNNLIQAFTQSHYHKGDVTIEVMIVNNLAVFKLKCECEVKEARYESNNLYQMYAKSSLSQVQQSIQQE